LGVLLALAAAVAYGSADFIGGLLSKRASVWTIAVVMQAAGAAGLSVVAAVGYDWPGARDLAWGAAAGIGSGAGTFFLYRGLAGGRMSVVAPLSAVGAAVLPVLIGVATGERPDLSAWIGVTLALPAIFLVSREPSSTAPGGGVRDGLLAGAGFGLLFVALGQVPEEAGIWPLAFGQIAATLILFTCSRLSRAPKPRPSSRVYAGAVAGGLISSTATLLYQLAVYGELVSVAAVLTSLYPAVTVALAAVVLHERVTRTQSAGLALAAVAVVLIAQS
jgi:drug/metabolite transporter (DMT)-like permease